jgi:hypothetical protein
MPSSRTPQLLNQDEVARLSEDPKNRVYQYIHDNPTQNYSAAEQKRYVAEIRNQYVEIRKQNPDWSDEKIQQHLRSTVTAYNNFADNNDRIFKLLTKRETTVDELGYIGYMLYLRDMQEQGAISEVQAQETIQNYLISKFKTNMTIEQYKAQMQREKALKEQENKAKREQAKKVKRVQAKKAKQEQHRQEQSKSNVEVEVVEEEARSNKEISAESDVGAENIKKS